MRFYTGKSIVTFCVALVGQHVATRSSRQARLAQHMIKGAATAWTGVDMSTSLSFQKLFLGLVQIQSTKDSTCTREHYCFFVVCHVRTSKARHPRQARHVSVSCRDAQRVESGLYGRLRRSTVRLVNRQLRVNQRLTSDSTVTSLQPWLSTTVQSSCKLLSNYRVVQKISHYQMSSLNRIKNRN